MLAASDKDGALVSIGLCGRRVGLRGALVQLLPGQLGGGEEEWHPVSVYADLHFQSVLVGHASALAAFH